MIAPKNAIEPDSSEPLPNSQRVYVEGVIHPDIRVPMREISLAPTKTFDGRMEVNEPVRVYDTSGPWGDPDFDGNVEQGLPALRRDWVLKRGDAVEYTGREVKAQDNGYLSDEHARLRNSGSPLGAPESASRKPLKASAGHPVTQLWYARQGIITPEMEYIAIRENHRIAEQDLKIGDLRNDISVPISTSSTLAAPMPRVRNTSRRSSADSRSASPRRLPGIRALGSRGRTRDHSRQY